MWVTVSPQIEVVNEKIGMAYSGMGPDFRYAPFHATYQSGVLEQDHT